MTSRARSFGPALVVCLSLGAAACGDSGGTGGEGGRDSDTTTRASSGSVTPATQASATDAGATTDSTTTTDAASSSGTVTAMPCVPPGVTGMVPTPGVCDGNTAVVCDAGTSMIVERPCAADEVCKVYPLTEHTFDGIDTLTWVESGTVEWAACLPADATPCNLIFNGNNWESELYAPQCLDDDRTYCGVPPYPDPVAGNGQKIYGTTQGYVHVVPCPGGDVCRAPLEGPVTYFDWLKCFDPAAAPCTVAESGCDGQTVATCDAAYGFETRTDCAASGNLCMVGCDSAFGTPFGRCVLPGTQNCDPLSPPATCDTEDTYTSCHECLTSVNDCSILTSLDPNGNVFTYPGDCVVADHGPQCAAEGTELCDSAVPDVCNGNVARACLGGIVYETTCGGGDVCRVGTNGRAGCTFAGAEACSFFDPTSCTGDDLHACCPDNGMISPFAMTRCAPGLEVIFDCTEISPVTQCNTMNGQAWCQ